MFLKQYQFISCLLKSIFNLKFHIHFRIVNFFIVEMHVWIFELVLEMIPFFCLWLALMIMVMYPVGEYGSIIEWF